MLVRSEGEAAAAFFPPCFIFIFFEKRKDRERERERRNVEGEKFSSIVFLSDSSREHRFES